MATSTLMNLRARLGPDLALPRVAAARGSSLVHLLPPDDGVPAQETLCGEPVTRRAPRRLLHSAGCPTCVTAALGIGATVAEDRHGALVNLRRVRPRGR